MVSVSIYYVSLSFIFDFPSYLECKSIRKASYDVYVNTIPRLCGKDISVKRDLIPFIQALEHRHTDVGQVRPSFVKRILASQACRYAYMFGDKLNYSQCEELLKNLAKCKLSFICAHGRPSVVPLINLKEIDTKPTESAPKKFKKKTYPWRNHVKK